MRNRHGFTLIELLVVVAIIIALLAILLPSMGRAIQVTEQAVCMSNQRQIGVGIGTYLSENFGIFPAYFMKPGAVPSHDPDDRDLYWFDTFRRFMVGDKTTELDDGLDLFACPTDPEYDYDHHGISYGYNYTNFGDWYATPHVAPSISQVTKPGQTLIVGDSFGLKVGSTTILWGSVISPPDIVPGGHFQYQLNGRHVDDATGILFIDGHAGIHDAAELNSQWRTPGGADYWWDVNEGPRTLYAN